MKSFARFSLTVALGAGGIASYGQSPSDQLFEHIYGGVAGAYIGNAMGAPVEGWTWEKIEKTYGFLDKFIADPRGKGVPNQPGWTEDGMERYKLLCRAIFKKGARINIEDLAREWVQLVESAVATDPYTVDKKTARQIAEGLYQVALRELQKTKSQTAEVESLLVK